VAGCATTTVANQTTHNAVCLLRPNIEHRTELRDDARNGTVLLSKFD